MKNALLLALITAAIILLVVGRIETFHMTEGEAFVHGWPYWIGMVALIGVAAWVETWSGGK